MLLDQVDRLLAGRRASTTCMPWRSSRLDSAKMLRTSSSTTSTFLPASASSRLVQALEHALLGRRQVGDHAVQEERGLVEQALGRLHALEHDALRHLAQLRLLARR